MSVIEILRISEAMGNVMGFERGKKDDSFLSLMRFLVQLEQILGTNYCVTLKTRKKNLIIFVFLLI